MFEPKQIFASKRKMNEPDNLKQVL